MILCFTSILKKLSTQCNVITESLTTGDLPTVYYKHIIYGAELVLRRVIRMKFLKHK